MLSWQRTICPVPQVTSGSDGNHVLSHFPVTNPGHVCGALRIGAMPESPTPLLLAEHCQWITLLQLSAKLLSCLLITLFSTKKGSSIACAEVVNLPRDRYLGNKKKKKSQHDHWATRIKLLYFSLRHWESKSIWLSDMKNCCCSHFKQAVYNILQKSSGSPASFKVRGVLPFKSPIFTHFGFRKIEVTFSEGNNFTECRTKIEHFKNQNPITLQNLPGLVIE